MRVVGGSLKGRVLTAFKGTKVRPTSDKVKGAIFNMLGQRLDGERVLDLFAGTGALGIEAISRGADSAVFVDKDCKLAQKNLTALGILEESAVVIERDVFAAIEGLANINREESFDIVFIDAPYKDTNLLKDILTKLSTSELLKDDGLIVCELAKKELDGLDIDFGALSNMNIEREKTYGDTAVILLRKSE